MLQSRLRKFLVVVLALDYVLTSQWLTQSLASIVEFSNNNASKTLTLRREHHVL